VQPLYNLVSLEHINPPSPGAPCGRRCQREMGNCILRLREITLLRGRHQGRGHLDTRQLTHRVMAAKGLNADDRVLA
jgi:hypothetical protein